MRHFAFSILVISIASLALGCGMDNSSTPAASSKVSNAKEKIGDAAEATTEAAKAKRDEYVLELKKQLEAFNVKYEDWKSRAAKAEGEEKTNLDKKVERAKVKRDEAAKKLDELKDAGHDRWEKLKEGAENAFVDLKKSLE